MKKVVVSFILLTVATHLNSQNKKDTLVKKLMLGFNIGANFSNLIVNSADANSTKIQNGAGINIGIIMEEKITEQISLIPKAEQWFNDCSLQNSSTSTPNEEYNVFPMHTDFMLHVVYKFNKTKNKWYGLFGPNFKIPLDQENVSNKTYNYKTDMALDFGFGTEKNLPYFQLAPEMRYSVGLLNLGNGSVFNKVYFHTVCLVFNFKG